MVNDNDIFIIFKINQYTGLFLNCNIYKIIIKNNITKKSKMFSTNLSYSLKNKNFNQIKLNSDSILIKVDKFFPCQKNLIKVVYPILINTYSNIFKYLKRIFNKFLINFIN